jgi:hypothetical protein
MPSRAAAIRELLRRGLAAEGFDIADGKTKSGDFEVIAEIKKKQERCGLGQAHARAWKLFTTKMAPCVLRWGNAARSSPPAAHVQFHRARRYVHRRH